MGKHEFRRNASTWAKLSKEWGVSGLTQKEFCVQRDVDYKKFTNWRYKNGQRSTAVRRSPRAVASKALVPVMVLEHDTVDLKHQPTEVLPTIGSTISVITPSGHILQISDDFNASTLLRLLKTLKDCG